QMLRQPNALARRWFHLLPAAVDVERMREAAAVLPGTHDFSAFAAAGTRASGSVCRVLEARVDSDARTVRFEIAADRFLHHMVRGLCGALVEVGGGRAPAAVFARTVAERDASRGGPTLPARGLFLLEVRYPADAEFEASAVWGAPPALPGLEIRA